MLKDFLNLTLPVLVTLLTGTPQPQRTTTSSSPATPTPTPTPVATTTSTSSGTASYFKSNGTIDAAAYLTYAASWDPDTISQRFGPTFAQLNPSATDTRPTNFKPDSKTCAISFANRTNPYELGDAGCVPDSDYWSDSGQVAYVPDASNDPGLDRIQTFAYYDNVFAISPRLDYASGTPHPDPQTQEPYYKTLLNGSLPRLPVAMVRNYGLWQNEALVVYKNGFLGVAGTQTSRAGNERPYPGFLFPANKVPTGIAVTTENEFALVTVMDTDTQKGQLAVIALEAKFLSYHTWPYMALPNVGSWSDFKLLGYIDLPMTAPNAVAAASNGFWNGPSQTNNEVLSQIDLTQASTRQTLLSGDLVWQAVIATKGYAIVSSKVDNKVAIVDLSPLFQYIRNSYISTTDAFNATIATRGDGAGQFPLTFAEKADIAPRVVWQTNLTAPTAVLAGLRIDRWSPDRHKAYVATEDGTINIIDASALMNRWDYEKSGVTAVIGTVKVGRNPVGMCFTRFAEYPLPLLPNGSDGKPTQPDPLNNSFLVACRGDREVDSVVTYDGQGNVYRRITDSRMGDPVEVSVAMRGPIVSVADYSGKKILSFRVGTLVDPHGRSYTAGTSGTGDWEFAGELSFGGSPFALNSTNVN